MDKALFEAVQQKLSAHQSHKTLTRQKSDQLLKDLLLDDAGHRMIATHTTKAGVRYRYYVSQPGLHGEARTAKLGSVSRVPVPVIEQAIVSALQKQVAEQNLGVSDRDTCEPSGVRVRGSLPPFPGEPALRSSIFSLIQCCLSLYAAMQILEGHDLSYRR